MQRLGPMTRLARHNRAKESAAKRHRVRLGMEAAGGRFQMMTRFHLPRGG